MMRGVGSLALQKKTVFMSAFFLYGVLAWETHGFLSAFSYWHPVAGETIKF
jgi:hypothetical protein